MTLITLFHLNQLINDHRVIPVVKKEDAPVRQQDEANFQLVMKQMFLGLPVTPLLKTHPQINQWTQQVQKLAPELFQPKIKLLINVPVIASLNKHAFIQVHANIGFKCSIPRLYEWAVRHPELSWQDRVKLWAVCEQYSVSPNQVQLTVLALHSSEPGQRMKMRWSQVQHEQTQQRLSQLISQSFKETPVLPKVDRSITPMLDLESIPEVTI